MHLGKIQTKKTQKRITLGFAAIVFAVVLAVVYFTFSSASITISPKALNQDVEFTAHVSQDPNFDPRAIETISGRILTSESEGSKDVTDVSVKTWEEKAKGKVTLYNETDKSQPLLATTQLVTTTGVKFRTDARVVVPAKGSVEVAVTADKPGASGNVSPTRFTIVKLWKGLQDKIYAKSTVAMSGGSRDVQVVTEDDINDARNAVADELYASLVDELKTKVSGDEKLIDDAVRKEVIDFSSSVKKNTQTSKFSVTVKCRVTAVVFDEKSLLDLAVSKLKEEIPDGRELVNYAPEGLRYTVSDYDVNAGTADLKTTYTGTTILKLSNEIFDKTKVLGLTKQEAVDYFLDYPDIEKVTVSLSPFWVKTIPSMEDKIDISIAENLEADPTGN